MADTTPTTEDTEIPTDGTIPINAIIHIKVKIKPKTSAPIDYNCAGGIYRAYEGDPH